MDQKQLDEIRLRADDLSDPYAPDYTPVARSLVLDIRALIEEVNRLRAENDK